MFNSPRSTFIKLLILFTFSGNFLFSQVKQNSNKDKESRKLLLALAAKKHLSLSQKLLIGGIDFRIRNENLGSVAFDMLNYNLYNNLDSNNNRVNSLNRIYLDINEIPKRVSFNIEMSQRIKDDIIANKWIGNTGVDFTATALSIYGLRGGKIPLGRKLRQEAGKKVGISLLKEGIDKLNYTQYEAYYQFMKHSTKLFFKGNTTTQAINSFANGSINENNLKAKISVVNQLLVDNQKFKKTRD